MSSCRIFTLRKCRVRNIQAGFCDFSRSSGWQIWTGRMRRPINTWKILSESGRMQALTGFASMRSNICLQVGRRIGWTTYTITNRYLFSVNGRTAQRHPNQIWKILQTRAEWACWISDIIQPFATLCPMQWRADIQWLIFITRWRRWNRIMTLSTIRLLSWTTMTNSALWQKSVTTN